ncbi:hypothetical protein [Ramlibacter sp.]|uniref:hypothetical protein n=1 Tax=Ramlibacter sp. TaxID=1917967 RepID=UPI002606BCDB|nr:hypothetical protein [Ramlibacter sp.]MDB5956260.1 hypothetical protein [Ramlibacter sp.]
MATAKNAIAKLPAPKKAKAAATPHDAAAAAGASKAKRIAKPAAAASDKADKPKKAKLVRDSFTMPKVEYAVLDELKLRAAKLGRPTKKSEVLRAGVQALAAMGDAAFLATVNGVLAIKTGRPANE